MRFLCALLISLLPFSAAADQPVVVELFTSQGCSSCPPADAYLSEISRREDVIALAYHVTYWDRLGWKDTFGSKEGTQRQYAYGRNFGTRSVWTPQFVVGGTRYSKGHFRKMVERFLNEADHRSPVTLEARMVDGRLGVTLDAGTARLGEAELIVAHVLPHRTVAVEHGENAGKSIDYTNIVTDFYPVGRWDGSGRVETSAELRGPLPIVVMVQEKGQGAIHAALRLE